MPSITDTTDMPTKILLIGKSGAGKTGALASLVTAGYRLRIIDTDNGSRILRSLLTDPHYPYAKLIAEKNINLAEAVHYVPVDTEMKMRTVTRKMPGENRSTSEKLLAPANANAWPKVLGLLDEWKDGDYVNLGPVTSWGAQDVLVVDSFSTLAKCVYYFSQMMNGRLGARDSGYDYQRDVGEAQSQLTRLLELLYASSIKCNVIVISHITWVDESRGVASRPREANGDGSISLSEPDGYPSAIGRALSPQMGKYFNDTFIVRSSGSGSAVQRAISTVPQDGVIAKNSVYLERDYPVTFGLAAIFAAMRFQELDPALAAAFAQRQRPSASAPALAPRLETRSPAASPA